MDFETQSFYYNLCDPNEALPPRDSRNVDMDAMGPTDMPVRGVNWSRLLARRIHLAQGSRKNPVQAALPPRPVCELFTGLPGSGKSTELLRLLELLKKPEAKSAPSFLPVYIDAERMVDLMNPIDVQDIRFAVLYGAEEVILHEEGDGGAPMHTGYLQRFWHWLRSTDVDLQKIELGAAADAAIPGGAKLSAGAKLIAELKTQTDLRERVRKHIAAQMASFLSETDEALALLNARAQDLGYTGLVIILDSLEKLRGGSGNWHDVLGSAEKIFRDGAPYLRLPVHVIYTIPPAVALRVGDDVHFIPMIKLFGRDGTVFPSGFQAAETLIRHRVPENVLHALFGQHKLLERLRRLIEWSGGYPREIVRLLQMAFTEAAYPLSDIAFERLLRMAGDRYRGLVPDNALDWLAKVALLHVPNVKDEEHREIVDFMFQENIVLRYMNLDQWFDLHPAVRDMPALVEAIARLRQARASASLSQAT